MSHFASPRLVGCLFALCAAAVFLPDRYEIAFYLFGLVPIMGWFARLVIIEKREDEL